MLHDHFNYTEEIHVQYERAGYYLFENFLADDALLQCQSQIDQMLGSLQAGRAIEDIISPHQRGAEWILELALQPRLLDLVERQVGPDIVLWSTGLLCKPPGAGITVPWHQDAPYWNITGNLAAGIWIPFDDVDESNGAMSVIPQWHTEGKLPVTTLGEPDPAGFHEEIDSAILPKNIEQARVQYRLRAGQLAIHHTMLPHNSQPNGSDRWRRVLVLRYMAAEGEMGAGTYHDYQTGEPFPREGILVRGHDSQNRGWTTISKITTSS